MSLCFSRYSGRESPCVLFNIPDGHVKEMPTAGSKHKPSSKEVSSVIWTFGQNYSFDVSVSFELIQKTETEIKKDL